MDIRVLQWLDTHLVHHRFEWSRLNVLRPLLRRLICDPFEARVLASGEDDEPIAEVIAAWDSADKHLTAHPDERTAHG